LISFVLLPGPYSLNKRFLDRVRFVRVFENPVDGATEQFVPQPDGLSVEGPGFPRVQFDNTQAISTTPTENKSVSRGDVDEQGLGADIA
jgi:hypothetical protein